MRRNIPDSDSAQKENHGVLRQMSKANVKSELRSGGSAANRRDAPQTRRAKPAIVESEDDDDDEGANGEVNEQRVDDEQRGNARESSDDDDDDDAETGSPSGRKRARINEDGDGVPVKKEKVHRPRRATLPRDTDGYVPGSIVRVQLENFVTYDWVEFRPGPNLNMILGPNGTGKSSIACALCIGLNGAPALLGRSSELNAFVKHGHESAYVEIELKGPIGSPNLVIRRKLTAKSRGSTFTLNGRDVRARDISERIAELNVQVGNLCSFLPQDRVSEFASMTPQQLLKETQRTAGDENLTAWHGILIEKGRELTTQRNELKEENKQIAHLEEKQKTLEKDVRRYKERQEIEQEIEILEVILPYVRYSESKKLYDEARVLKEKARAEYRRLEEANRPLKDVQNELAAQYEELEAERNTLKKEVQEEFKKNMPSMEKRAKAATARAEEAMDSIKALKRKERDRVKAIQKARDDLTRLQDKVDNPPEHENVPELVELMKPFKDGRVDLDVKRNRINGEIEALLSDAARHDLTVARGKHDLQQLDNIKNKRIEALRRWDADCAEVVVWLDRNRATNDFAARVTPPAYVALTVADRRYVNQVEACLSAGQFKTFVTHSEEDFRMFNRLFIDTPEALGHKVRVTVWFRPKNEAQLARPPLEMDELKSIGFDGYAIDYIDCSEGLRWFLMKEINMHRTPIALDAGRVDENRAQEALSRSGMACSYVAGATIGQVTRSAYGQRRSINSTRSVARARNLVDPPVDAGVKRAIEERIAEAQRLSEELGEKVGELRNQDVEVVAELQALKDQFDALGARKKKATDIMQQIVTNKSKLESLKTHLEDRESRPSADAERPKYEAIVRKTITDRTKVLNEFLVQTQALMKTQKRLSNMLLQQMQLDAKMEAIDVLCNECTAEAKRVKLAFDEASARFEELKKDSRAKVDLVNEMIGNMTPEMHAKFRQREVQNSLEPPEEQWTVEKTEEQLETERTKLDLNNATDSGVIQEYENRENQIKNKKEGAERREEKVHKLEERIQKTRDSWYPALTHLVGAIGEKFSAAFDRIRCAGEIRIAEAEDYDKWAIEIYVKFRDEEPLTQLTAQRQSGGERSLTTIMYLMSLTEYARAPFSLVDEINQGMDQQYERSVHDQLVNVTCSPESGQYFLITPKLLPGLQYHDRMKILCVNNGEWLPDSRGIGNMGKMIDAVLAKRAMPSAS